MIIMMTAIKAIILPIWSAIRAASITGARDLKNKEHEKRQSHQHIGGKLCLACKYPHLSAELEPFADQVADVLKNFSQVPSRFPLDDHRNHEVIHVRALNSLGQVCREHPPHSHQN